MTKPELEVENVEETLKGLYVDETLKALYALFAPLDSSISDLVIKKEGISERNALNLINGMEYIDRFRPNLGRTEKWRVEYLVESGGKLNDKMSISMVLNGVTNEGEGLNRLEIIATQLQQLYQLPYKPRIYRDRKPV